MPASAEGTVGILPPGALGVSFFHHLTRESQEIDGSVYFLSRPGSASAEALGGCDALRIAVGDQVQAVPAAGLFKGDLLAAQRAGALPEVLLVCPNPDQLLDVIDAVVELFVRLHDEGRLQEVPLPLPIVVLSANGIYFQRLRQIYLEKLEEATLLGRLPDLRPDLMPRIIGRFLRGVTIQTGVREGAGAVTIYRPGPRGLTRLAGGDEPSRRRACAVLAGKGGWFELAAHSSATRLEFDKALVNLTSNLLGQLYALDDAGRFTLLRVEQIVVPAHLPEIRALSERVFKVGQAVRAYGPADTFASVFAEVLENLRLHRTHTPSSLQWLDMKLRAGTLTAELTPTETWLLEPLVRYARSAGLDEEAASFEQLKARLFERLRLASQVNDGR